MKVKTAILTGNALRWAVFVANGMALVDRRQCEYPDDCYWLVYSDGAIKHAQGVPSYSMSRAYAYGVWAPDENDSQAGPIIDEYRICTVWDGSCWIGCMHEPFKQAFKQDWYHNQTASTRLLAAMRTFVSFKFGSEVNLPDGIACT